MKNYLIAFFFLGFSWSIWGQSLATLQHDGSTRNFNYYIPTSYSTGTSLPLVLVLHGLTQTGAGVMDITQFNALAETQHFIVCYPDGINNAWNANMNVNVSSADDKGYIEALAYYFQANFQTNPLRQYLVGFSNGGFMANKMICESDMCFAAIASVSGNMSDTTYSNCNPLYPSAVLHIHGTADFVVPYNGGAQTGVSVDQSMEKWRLFLGCNSNPPGVSMPNNSLTDLSSPTRYTYVNSAAPLELIKITGGGHQWPGISTLVGGAGNINMDFYSPQVIWDFLKSNSCATAQLSQDKVINKPAIYPNPASTHIEIKGYSSPVSGQILNSQGMVVLKFEPTSSIEIETLPEGMYWLEILHDQQLERILWSKIN